MSINPEIIYERYDTGSQAVRAYYLNITDGPNDLRLDILNEQVCDSNGNSCQAWDPATETVQISSKDYFVKNYDITYALQMIQDTSQVIEFYR